MFRLLRYLKQYKTETLLAPFFKLVEVAFELTVPLVIARLIDNGIEKRDLSYIIYMCGLLGVFALCGFLSALLAQYFAAKAAVGFGTALRHDLFAHIGTLSFADTDRLGTSALITGLTGDINQVQTGINLTLRLILRSPFVVFGAVAMAFTVDARAALIFAAAVPLLAAVIFAVMLASIPIYKKVQEGLDALVAKTRDNLKGVRVIRAFLKEKDEEKEFNRKNDALAFLQIKVGKIAAFLNPATLFLINAAIVLLIYTGALRVESGHLTKGGVAALYNYMSQILVELIKLASLIITAARAVACGNRIEGILRTEPGMVFGAETDGDKQAENAVEFQNVSFAYGAGAPTLQNITLSLKRGQTLGVIGATGSGKSTLAHLIERFYDATEGAVYVDGTDVKAYTAEGLRKKIGIVPQKTVLFHGTLRENIRMGLPDAGDEEISEALRIAQADGIAKEKTGGLDFVIEQDGRNLSGGQRQRLCIARALVRKPEILILDDATSALDYQTAKHFFAALTTADFTPTVLLISQRISALQSADRIAVLEEGRLAGLGTKEELRDTCEVFREICRSQHAGGEQS